MLVLTRRGIYCPAGEFYIDPTSGLAGGVERAVITHAHSDHARRGAREYFCATDSVGLVGHRLGTGAPIRGVPYGEVFRLGAVSLSLHPAGHMLGSAQVRLEHGNQVWVVSGDYKRQRDASCEPFEALQCDVFVTEATFAHPRYAWDDVEAVIQEILSWWEACRAAGRNAVLYCYAMGKAQRVLAELAPHFAAESGRRALTFGEVTPITDRYRERGVRLLPTESLEAQPVDQPLRGELIITTRAIHKSEWYERLGPCESAFASGWTKTGGGHPGYGARDRGFCLSDHVDWPGLLRTIRETGARQVYVQTGPEEARVNVLRRLRKEGIPAQGLRREGEPQQLALFE